MPLPVLMSLLRSARCAASAESVISGLVASTDVPEPLEIKGACVPGGVSRGTVDPVGPPICDQSGAAALEVRVMSGVEGTVPFACNGCGVTGAVVPAREIDGTGALGGVSSRGAASGVDAG